MYNFRRVSLLVIGALALTPPFTHAVAMTGQPIKGPELRTLAGSREKVLRDQAKATVIVFFRAGERSLAALKDLTSCEKALAGKPVRWVAVVSGLESVDEVKSQVQEAGVSMPVLLDDGDAFYQQLEVRQHPTVVFLDAQKRVVAAEGYRQVDFCDVVRARVRFVLGEITQAELDKALNPEASALPGADLMKKAMRDVNMARRLLGMDAYDDAIKACQKALSIAPVGEAYAVMGDAYQKKGNCAEARKAYAAALRLKADEPSALSGQQACAGK